ncbi:MAG: hypothetical protein CVV02_12040 [Firmicutes bacterium HGW-Firmicutes-7]|nr:MAG: hypothetical protein CVV02_12040 [Firmicutes bacterium HGW-Firmicutes-7]
MQRLLSHPNRNLEDHLEEVKSWGIFYKENSACDLLKNIDDNIIKSFFIFHDIGKSTAFFQDYIQGKPVQEHLKSHAGLSAMLFLYYHILVKTVADNEDLIVAMAYAILRHHGDMNKFSDVNNYMINDKIQLLETQYSTIDASILVDKLAVLGLDREILDEIFNGDKVCFTSKVSDFLKCRRKRLDSERPRLKRQKEQGDYSTKAYFTMQVLFSLLTDADKSQVTLGHRDLAQRVDLKADVAEHIKRKATKASKLNTLRSMAFEEVNNHMDVEKNLFTLTLPTGMGKTLNSFNYALRLRQKLYEKYNTRYRIIYVIPFMSIIDQNANVIEEVLKESNTQVTSSMLCKHHHLTEITWITNENTLEENENAQILIEGWNSEIVITTFQQFFSTLAGHKNSMQRKFNKLCNTIVIIDEIQAIPVKYYKFIGKMLTDFAALMKSKVIAMTATQPHIFETGTSQALCDYRKYYSQLSRTIIINELKFSRTIEEFVEGIECQSNKRYLFILNTIESAKKMYNLLKDKFFDSEITYLSTMLPPKERLNRIHQIKEKKYDIVVSTQLVEAGVDIDFDVVYRDLAPLPSIFQSAGRANREGGEYNKGEVHLIKLKDSNGYYADKVYRNAKTDLDITEKILKDYERLEESEFMAIIETYFDKMADGDVKSQHISDALIKGAASQWFYGDKEACILTNEILPLNSFELIEDNGEKVTVFIELDEEAEKLWKKYTAITHEKVDKWEHRMNLKTISRKMSEYMVDVSVATKNKYNRPPLMDENHVYYYVAKSEIDKFYSTETGYGVETNLYYY